MSDLISTPSRTQSSVSNEAFEVLIDLLASDGADDDQPDAGTRANPSLRDASGKLDYAKIRSMFATHNRAPAGEEKGRVEDGDSEDEHRSHRSSSTVPSNPTSPKPANAGHRRSSTFGNQPWVPVQHQPVQAPTPRALSFDELNAALAGAHEEVRSLRERYDQLRALVSLRDPVKSDLPVEIAGLSEQEAKTALNTLVRSLNVSLDAVAPMAAAVAPPCDVASVARALRFLGSVDELVWRRSSPPSGPRTLLPVFSEENAVSLLARLELWERAIRRRC